MANLFLPLFLLYLTALATTTNARLFGFLGGGDKKDTTTTTASPKGLFGNLGSGGSSPSGAQLSMVPNNIAQRWKDLSGQNNWEGLLSPLDPDLQKYLIHYAALCESTYDSLNTDHDSTDKGDCKFPMESFFAETGLVLGNPFKYTIVTYLYASENPVDAPNVPPPGTPGIKDSNWVGYIAVATDEGKQVLGRRDVVVVWRGTKQGAEWFKDFNVPLVPAEGIVGKISKMALIHKGFLTMYTSTTFDPKTNNNTSAQEQVQSALNVILDRFKNEEVSITVTGHSIGAAMAIISGADIAANGYSKTCSVTVITYGGPRVGDVKFKKAINSMTNLRVLRVVSKGDTVTAVPPKFIYAHVGANMTVDCKQSPDLAISKDSTGSLHLLEPAYLHPLATANGAKNLRSLACVNKLSGALNPKYKIPKFWWNKVPKPLVQQQDGSWVLK